MHASLSSRPVRYGLLCMAMMSATPAHSQPSQDQDRLPVLYGLKLDAGRITVDVVSFGCTEPSHFSVRLDPAEPGTYRLSVLRNTPDRCRMGAHIVQLALELPAVPDPTGAKFTLANSLGVPGTLRRSDP